jgi:hypothetical protein
MHARVNKDSGGLDEDSGSGQHCLLATYLVMERRDHTGIYEMRFEQGTASVKLGKLCRRIFSRCSSLFLQFGNATLASVELIRSLYCIPLADWQLASQRRLCEKEWKVDRYGDVEAMNMREAEL